MKAFEINGRNGWIKIGIAETFSGSEANSPMGGKEGRFRLAIMNQGFAVEDDFYSSMGQFTDLQSKLTKLHTDLQGTCVTSNPYENNLELQFTMNTGGHMNIKGRYYKLAESHIELNFEIMSDQSYLTQTLRELESFCENP